jgi:methionyl-tRNA synthetase
VTRVFLTTTIPYVNAAPHIGFALEAVQADLLARHHRRRGHASRLLSGTDDNSLKNVLAAEAAGVGTQAFVDANAERFAALAGPLSLRLDDFIRTSTDPRHRRGVEALWRACAGDLYQDRYEGLYCVGCEHYLTPDDLTPDGHCPEHVAPPQRIAETNWFFRLSRYTAPIRDAIVSGRLRIEPAARRNEVLAVLDAGLRDLCVSRSAERARGWGIPVPGSADQTIYVWFDALGNYVTSLGYGGDDASDLDRWWSGADRRIHLIGKGVLRFHAVYWPAMLLSAGLALPTDILVHDYLTVDGHKISKSRTGTAISPRAIVDRYGTDALRWWLLRDVPRVGDADFTVDRLEARYREDLAGGFGNLVNRVVTMVHRYRSGVPVDAGTGPESKPLRAACGEAPETIAHALDAGDVRPATAALRRIVDEANRYVETTGPWTLAAAERTGGDPVRLDAVLGDLLFACRVLAGELEPFLPDAAARIAAQCTPVGGLLPAPAKVF